MLIRSGFCKISFNFFLRDHQCNRTTWQIGKESRTNSFDLKLNCRFLEKSAKRFILFAFLIACSTCGAEWNPWQIASHTSGKAWRWKVIHHIIVSFNSYFFRVHWSSASDCGRCFALARLFLSRLARRLIGIRNRRKLWTNQKQNASVFFV